MELKHFLNGEFVTESNLLISPRDLGFTRGYAVFDFLRTYNQIPFHLTRHISRLFRSARAIDLDIPWSEEEIATWVKKTIQINTHVGDIALRVIISGGIPVRGIQAQNPTILIIVDEAITFPEEMYARGISVILREYRKFLPEAKTTHYIQSIIDLKEHDQKQYDEVLYYSDNSLREGAFSNVFIVSNQTIATPEANILPGVTRSVVLEELTFGKRIEKREVSLDELTNADEVFLTVSGKGVVPVTHINGNSVGSGSVGTVTKALRNEYLQYIKEMRWCPAN